jgi:S1-C subfamily serine protease
MLVLLGLECGVSDLTLAQEKKPAPTPKPLPAGRWVLGVYGRDTPGGFEVTGVVRGAPATKLWDGRQWWTLVSGDYITEIDGSAITLQHTLRQALADSGGEIDLTVTDTRQYRGESFRFEKVSLQWQRSR